jgi:hypothetical protein
MTDRTRHPRGAHEYPAAAAQAFGQGARSLSRRPRFDAVRRRAAKLQRPLFFATLTALLVVALSAAPGARLGAQEAAVGPRYRNVISANPFGLVLLLFNAEYERAATSTSTFGVGGSYISQDDEEEGDEEEYLNADVFWRFYPGARVYDGWAFGAKLGVTTIPDEGTFFGFGFDVNRSWLLGANDNFYVGAGFGLKRLVGAGDRDLELEIIPTVRIVNIGLAF